MNKINVHEMAHICEPLGCFGYLEILGMGTSGGTIHVLLPPRRDHRGLPFRFISPWATALERHHEQHHEHSLSCVPFNPPVIIFINKSFMGPQ
jgi:hypothetical protein